MEFNKELCTILDHPIQKELLAKLRNKKTHHFTFRAVLSQLSMFMTYEVIKQNPVKEIEVETPFRKTVGYKMDPLPILVSVMRAGNGMLEGALRVLPRAKVGHLGFYRDKETKEAVEYYEKLPKNIENKNIILLDPLFATGNTVLASIKKIKEYNIQSITFICILASLEGLKKLKTLHPDINVFTLSIESELNDKAYLIPGLGDAGDRIYGTD